MSLSRIEQETIITFNEQEKEANVYTFNRKMKRRLEELSKRFPNDVTLDTVGSVGDVTYSIPKQWVRINAGKVLSAEQKAALAEQARTRFNLKS